MKKFIFIISILIPVISIAMENQLQITNRHLNTLKRPHITIINKLPSSFPTTRIDISDQAEITKYINNSYRPDASTKTIYANNGTRFSPQIHKAIRECERFGMNDKGDAALIAAYVRGATKPIKYFVIGKGSSIQFGDIITFTTKSNDVILLHNDKEVQGKEIAEFPEIFGLPDFDKISEDIFNFLEENSYIKTILFETLLLRDTLKLIS